MFEPLHQPIRSDRFGGLEHAGLPIAPTHIQAEGRRLASSSLVGRVGHATCVSAPWIYPSGTPATDKSYLRTPPQPLHRLRPVSSMPYSGDCTCEQRHARTRFHPRSPRPPSLQWFASVPLGLLEGGT